jgi:hypothetical protein
MYQNHKKGRDNKINQYFLILYQGLRTKTFYWEFVNTIRKLLILVSFALEINMRILVTALSIIFTLRLQKYLNPYKLKENNELELYAIIVAVVTVLSGLIFNQEESTGYLNIIFLVIVAIVNIIFILKWIIIAARSFKSNFKWFPK